MGLRVAVQSGNWSSGSTWNGGVLPTTGDVVASNTYTVTIDQNVNVDSITNTAQSIVTEVPLMTSNTTPSGIASANVELIGNSAYLAFNRNTTIGSAWHGSTVPTWLAYEFPQPIAIDKYQMVLRGEVYDPRSWTFEAWDGSSWIILHTVSGSAGSYTSPNIGNSTPYNKYRVNISATNGSYAIIIELYLYQYLSTSSATAGGEFVLDGGVNLTCTNSGNGITSAIAPTITYSSSISSSITSNIIGSTTTNISTIVHSGSGSLNIVGNVYGSTANANTTITMTGFGNLNIVGNVFGPATSVVNCNVILINNSSNVVNIVGNIIGSGTQKQMIRLLNGTLNIVGNVTVINTTANFVQPIVTTNGNLTITGNLSCDNIVGGSDLTSYCLSNGASCTTNIIGNIIGDINQNSTRQTYCLISSGYVKQIGYISAGRLYPSFVSTAAGAINILTGPFISSTYGVLPIYVSRMHYFRTSGSYFEFRDNSTDGALSPGAIASASRLVSPDTVIDAPSPSNVRFGTTYASGSMTGTMQVPAAQNVQYGVLVDNTVGTAALKPSDVWDMALTNISASNSIGVRIKNAATVETVGSQLQSLLNG